MRNLLGTFVPNLPNHPKNTDSTEGFGRGPMGTLLGSDASKIGPETFGGLDFMRAWARHTRADSMPGRAHRLSRHTISTDTRVKFGITADIVPSPITHTGQVGAQMAFGSRSGVRSPVKRVRRG